MATVFSVQRLISVAVMERSNRSKNGT